jgi:hypothetical protein
VRGFTLLITCLLLLCVAPAMALAQDATGGADPSQTQQPSNSASTGGMEYGTDPDAAPRVYVPGTEAVLMDNGFAAAPADAPAQVQEAIFAANDIVGMPYVYGGGHRSFKSKGYDCSGTVSYALHGGSLLKSPLDSGSFMRWGQAGRGAWVTVYTNPGHAYVVIAGLRLDTSSAGEPVSSGNGPRWRTTARRQRGYRARHPIGF